MNSHKERSTHFLGQGLGRVRYDNLNRQKDQIPVEEITGCGTEYSRGLCCMGLDRQGKKCSHQLPLADTAKVRLYSEEWRTNSN